MTAAAAATAATATTSPSSVLVVEDDEAVREYLVEALTENGHLVQVAPTGAEALEAATNRLFDIILLDLGLPDIDGLQVCARLRAQMVATPILMITARDSEEDKIAGLDSGADDYIVKPFSLGELNARMRALLRRRIAAPAPLRASDLTLDPSSRRAFRAGKAIPLSSTEYSLLEILIRNVGRVMTRTQLLQHVWQYDFAGNDNVLDVYVNYLRKKIDKGFDAPLLHTVRGVGYRLGDPAPAGEGGGTAAPDGGPGA
jgi:DNA-binding response OmpR family regulator